jgi:hypothetical protein
VCVCVHTCLHVCHLFVVCVHNVHKSVCWYAVHTQRAAVHTLRAAVHTQRALTRFGKFYMPDQMCMYVCHIIHVRVSTG